MSVTFYSPGLDLEVNLSNSNAFDVQKRLGYEADYCGQFDADDLLGRVLLKVAIGEPDDLGSPDVQEKNVVSCGKRPGYYADVYARLADLATAAAALGLPVSFS